MSYNDYLDHEFIIFKERRKIISKFRKDNFFLYNKNYNSNIEVWQSYFHWEELPIDKKYNFIKLGYNESIWDLGSAPIKYVIPKMITIYKYKINNYYFNIMIDKCLSKRLYYEKRILWIKIKFLYNKNRVITDFKFIELPDELFRNVIIFIDI